jgi:peptidoglycan/LPS O-acetylase OafA/YrhL
VISDPPPFDRYGPRQILASLLSLENIVGVPMGSDGPLWSLGFEWIFYFCFPAALLSADALSRRFRVSVWLARGAMLAATLALLIGAHKFYASLLWLIWIGGALAHLAVETGRWPRWARWSGAAACAAGFVLGLYINYRLADVLIGLGAASFLSQFPPGERGLNPKLDRSLSGGSYSLYVIHMPILAFLAMLYNERGLLPRGGVPMTWVSLAMMAGVVVTVGVAALVFHRLFEANTDALRRRLSRTRSSRRGVAADSA